MYTSCSIKLYRTDVCLVCSIDESHKNSNIKFPSFLDTQQLLQKQYLYLVSSNRAIHQSITNE